MAQAKKISKALTSLITGDTFARALDRSEDIDDVVETLKEHWEFDIENRRPGVAYTANGEMQSTDLDLSCLLATLARRKALVILPKYLSDGTNSNGHAKTGQVLLSNENRRGQILRLSSNKEFFSFSMLVNDQNVIDTANGGSAGAPRNFMIVGKDGRWHSGWDTINFVPDAKENAFLQKFDLLQAGGSAFRQFVHPNRWTSFYGQYYFLTKCVIQRLEEEASELRKLKKVLAPKMAMPGKDSPWTPPDEPKFDTVAMSVPVMEVEVDAPFTGSFNLRNWSHDDTVSYDDVVARLKQIDNEYLPALRFATRATELAFYKARGEVAGFPSWISGASWYDHLIKRTAWRRLVYGQLAVGQRGVALRYRIRAKEVEVARR